MNPIKPSISLATLATVVLCLSGLDTTSAQNPASTLELGTTVVPVYSQAVQPGTITAKCEGTLAPDLAVIVGGITAESLKPLEAKAQLDKQLAEIKRYISSKGGTVSLLETVRAIRQRQQGSRRQDKEKELPFILVQRLEFKFPRGVGIDEILERLLQLGFDRYGRAIRPQRGGYGPQVVVYYRFTNAENTLERIYRRCKQEAVKNWCQVTGERATHAACRASPAQLDWHFPTRSLRLQSQPVLKEHGSQPIVINFPWQGEQLNAIDLMGDVTLQLIGTLVLSIPRELSQ
ncbi:MAG: SIMPL domain-containing protein [Gammaproteobacteria bacterium]